MKYGIEEGLIYNMKKIILILLAALLLFAAGAAIAEEPEADPAEVPAVDPAEAPDADPAEEPVFVPAEEPFPEPAEVPAEEPAVQPEAEPAQEPVPEAAGCAHAHTKTEYYFDAPVYYPVDDANHAVDGMAVVTVICEDCGAVLSSESESGVQEISPHVFRDGCCALCGWAAPAAAEAAVPAVREAVVSLPAMDGESQYACTLTGRDLEEADTLVLRPDGRDTALVVETERFREEIGRSGGTLTAEIVKPGGQNVSASLRLYDAYGAEVVPEGQGVSLRIYAENRDTPYTVSFTGPYGSAVEEARWVNNNGGGYWTVTWRGNGMYEYK